MFSVQQIIESTNGVLLSSVATSFIAIGTDTRKDLSGQIFWALKGEQFDGHDFCKNAVEAGAACLIVERTNSEIERLAKKVTVVKVEDTLLALQNFARHHRRHCNNLVIGITGSNGKTTTKEFLATILATRYRTHYSQGSFNNHWGVPFTLLAQPANTEVVVAEMGMNHSGEIEQLVQIAEPNIVVVTTVGAAHVEHFGTVAKIAEAKSEIYRFAKASTIKIFNLDNEWTVKMHAALQGSSSAVITFSEKLATADVQFQISKLEFKALTIKARIRDLERTIEVPVFGRQNLINLMAASACALAAGMTAQEILAALPKCRTVWGRNQIIDTKRGGQILFDGYNANPDSMRALLENIPLLPPELHKIGVFGQMLELGEASVELHKELGCKVAEAGFNEVWFSGKDHEAFKVGFNSVKSQGHLFADEKYSEQRASEVAALLKQGSIAVVKGSRGNKLERFVIACDPVHFLPNK
jgi:UDP-N-acetylmuramoyl-tripeptide--D-alanyl-D-alanine ligase